MCFREYIHAEGVGVLDVHLGDSASVCIVKAMYLGSPKYGCVCDLDRGAEAQKYAYI